MNRSDGYHLLVIIYHLLSILYSPLSLPMLKTLLYQEKKIAYSVNGNGRPVMLIHGFGEDSTVWRHQAELLQKKFKLIIPDLPGSGSSEMITDMSMSGMAEVMQAILKAEKIDTCIMIGHSMGGYITLAYAEKYPKQLNGFGLFHSSGFADSEDKKEAREKGIEFIEQHGAFEFLKASTPKLFALSTRDERPAMIEEQIASLHNFSATSLVSYYRAMIKRPDRTAVLRKAAVPVLFVLGKYDVAVPVEDGLKQCHLPKKSYIHILRKSGHMGMLEEKDESHRILEEFLLEI
jgi:pimeloyl-ACP methyl ester carboxylesterase